MAKEVVPVPKLFLSWTFSLETYPRYAEGSKYWFEEQYMPWYQAMVKKDFPGQDQRILDIFSPDFYPYTPERHYRDMQTDYLRLAQMTNADVVNIGEVGQALRHSGADFETLTLDDTHPTIQLSYLCALMFYAAISNVNDVSAVTYVPAGVSDIQGERIRTVVNTYLKEK